MTTNLDRWQERILWVKQELFELGEMRPGALSKQYNVCGKPGCRCKAPRDPQKHGPYYQISYTHLGKSTSEFVRRELVAEARRAPCELRQIQTADTGMGGAFTSNRTGATEDKVTLPRAREPFTLQWS